jgi:hypothetical protein
MRRRLLREVPNRYKHLWLQHMSWPMRHMHSTQRNTQLSTSMRTVRPELHFTKGQLCGMQNKKLYGLQYDQLNPMHPVQQCLLRLLQLFDVRLSMCTLQSYQLPGLQFHHGRQLPPMRRWLLPCLEHPKHIGGVQLMRRMWAQLFQLPQSHTMF